MSSLSLLATEEHRLSNLPHHSDGEILHAPEAPQASKEGLLARGEVVIEAFLHEVHLETLQAHKNQQALGAVANTETIYYGDGTMDIYYFGTGKYVREPVAPSPEQYQQKVKENAKFVADAGRAALQAQDLYEGHDAAYKRRITAFETGRLPVVALGDDSDADAPNKTAA